MEFTDTRFLPSFYPISTNQSTQKSIYEINYCDECQINYQVKNFDSKNTQIVESTNSLTFMAENMPVKIKELYSPDYHQSQPYAMVNTEVFKVFGVEGSTRSWRDLGKFYYDLNNDRDQLSELTLSDLRELKLEEKSDEEKIKLLYTYLKENHRYVNISLGVGGWQCFDASYVEQNRYGDCKALSNYMHAILQNYDIPSYHAIVNSGRNDSWISEDFSSSRFNHMILYLPDQDQWLECTSSSYPVNYLGSGTEGNKAMLLTQDGGDLLSIPKLKEEHNKTFTNMSISFDAKNLMVHNEITSYNIPHEYYRSIANIKDANQQKKKVYDLINFSSYHLKNYEINASEDEPKSTFSYEIELENFHKKAGNKILIPIGKIVSVKNPFRKEKKRINDIHVDYGFTKDYEIKIVIPEGAEVESIPKNYNYKGLFGEIEFSAEQKDNHIFIKMKRVNYELNRSAADYDKLNEYFNLLHKIKKVQVIFRPILN